MKTVHLHAKKTVCHICAKEVRDIKHHYEYMHGDKKPVHDIPCEDPDCSKMFKTPQEARNHMNAVHLNKRNQCPICQGWFKNLSTHISSLHRNVKKHPCPKV